MPDKDVQFNFHAPATLRKWPSVNGERVSASLGARPYLIIDGTLDQCIRRFNCDKTVSFMAGKSQFQRPHHPQNCPHSREEDRFPIANFDWTFALKHAG